MACIGLLLGSLHASSLDDAAKKAAKENMINNCPTCARLQNVSNPPMNTIPASPKPGLLSHRHKGLRKRSVPSHQGSVAINETTSLLHTIAETQKNGHGHRLESAKSPSLSTSSSPGAAAPFETMDRQSHTRRYSLDSPGMKNIFDPGYTNTNRKKNESEATRVAVNFGTSERISPASGLDPIEDNISDIDNDDHNSESSGWSAISNPADDSDFFRPVSRIKAAKYVFLTLKQAVANSLFVIAIGSFGFYYIEDMTAVNAFYFTTVLLTTVGYGDIVPVTQSGKLFCTIYGLVAGTVLLHNMSMISMIPLELRKRRIERAVLMQVRMYCFCYFYFTLVFTNNTVPTF